MSTMDAQIRFQAMGLFDAKVPRYTSYPTAAHFKDAVGAGDHRTWVEAVPEGAEISLYLHIPFCRRLCWFCACRTQGTQTLRPVEAYIQTLKNEISLLAQHLKPSVTLGRMHWGGGTPTLLSLELIEDLASHIAAVLPLSDGAEFSVEIDPAEVDQTRIDALAKAGMNRASIGIQDFDPDIQVTIGRVQGFDITADAVEMLRKAGVHSLNADILFGLPDQTGRKITESVQKLLSLSPDRVALYGYAHVPWMARRQSMIPSDRLPTPQERLRLFETARRLFVWDGYREIGIDHFATAHDGLAIAQETGALRRNFQGYTDDNTPWLIGLGASAISRFPEGYTQNISATSGYATAIENGTFATARGHTLTDEDRLRGRVIEKIMCDFNVVADDFGEDAARVRSLIGEARDTFGETLGGMRGRLLIPTEARPLTRMVARHLDAYEASPTGHSSAI